MIKRPISISLYITNSIDKNDARHFQKAYP